MSRLFMRRTRSILSLLVLVGCMASSAYAQSDANDNMRTIHVEGEATVQVAPDEATVRFGIVTRADTPEAARTQNGEASSAALQAVRAADVPEEQIQMEQLQLRPHRVYDEERRRTVEDGFEAVRTVRVTLNDPDQVPVVVAAVVDAGANRLESVEYGLQDRTAARNEALSEAARNARSKAEQLASALDVQVGAVHTIREQQFSFPRALQMGQARTAMMAESASDANPEAYAAGTIEVEAQVSVVFMLVP
ncbi:SIMPL domain-containing protein [Longimonas halophila]|uniref:SIMPL domain-containing protein n=1 Tax=Longimonas halophila TaxID=1469170 RepID=A0A2H3NPI7_9BACT|nr:SIMPL domain-containing protein [Longimonas halophila]PEN09181.1 SIMPL domain-containing protein [Longimonas halophila]